MYQSCFAFFLILLTNAIPLGGVLLFNWSWAEIIQIYVIENYILIFFDTLRVHNAKSSDWYDPPMFLVLPMMCGIPVFYLFCLTLMIPIKFMPWSNFKLIALVIFVCHMLHYIQTNFILKQGEFLKKDEIIAQSLGRLVVIMCIGLFGPIFVGLLPIREKGLVLLMVIVRIILDVWNFTTNHNKRIMDDVGY